MKKNLFLLSFASALAFMGTAVHAEESSKGGNRSHASNATWKAECGTCHVAFPAEFLGPKSWTSVMSKLKTHYGVDASLSPDQETEITQFLTSNAKGKRAQEATKNPPRITETAWFIRKHDEVPANKWKHPLIKNASNCAACHTDTETAGFRESLIKMPR